MPNNASTVYLKEYQSPTFLVDNIALEFDLYDDHVLVTSTLQLLRQKEGALHLLGDELELIDLQMDNKPMKPSDYRLQEGNLVIESCPDVFKLRVVTQIYPQNNTQLSGLYRSNQLFCTQCEAEGFRRITFFPDRPDVLAKYTTKISADITQYPVLLSNGNLVDSGKLDGNRHWVLWDDPFKKPSYLFALVAGDLACVNDEFLTSSGKRVDLRLFVEHGDEDKCAHALTSLKKSMAWDETEYGREYDLDIFMIVAVSDFNMGAMENKGLNIFNSKYILARPDTATDKDYADVEGVVAHEYFHNWTGNRITCRDWFQLSLKEGLTVFRDQEFSRDMNSRDVNRIKDVIALRQAQFPEDAGAMAHPVRPESYEEINNFYTATIYNKGAEVIRMQHSLLGSEGFRKGMDLYFDRHDGCAVTIDDFVAAMEDANHVDLTQFKRWYSQAGTPEVRVKTTYSQKTLTLQLSQSCPATAECKDKKPFHIPIKWALFDAKGRALPTPTEVLELKEQQHTFVFKDVEEKPVVSLLREFSAPIRLVQEISDDDLLFLLRHETDGYAKWNAGQELMRRCFHDWFKKPNTLWTIPEALQQALSEILDNDALDKALRALLLTVPSFEEVAASVDKVDPSLIEDVRLAFQKAFGLTCQTQLQGLYETLWQTEDNKIEGEAYGRRALRNLCLNLMMKANESTHLAYCQRQFATAKTMTDQVASFALLVNCSDSLVRQEAIDAFYAQWANEELVLDKWFAIQAMSELPNTLEQVKNLLNHPAFSIKNPNKVRAVIGAFCMYNPRHFHDLNGQGYAFLKEMLVTLDAINPQVSARLANPFTLWQRYDSTRGKLMKKELENLSKLDLSCDLSEIVNKSLVVL